MKLTNIETMLARRGGTLEQWYRHACEQGDHFFLEEENGVPVLVKAGRPWVGGMFGLEIDYAETEEEVGEEDPEFAYEVYTRMEVTFTDDGALEFSFFNDDIHVEVWEEWFGKPEVLAQVVPYDAASPTSGGYR